MDPYEYHVTPRCSNTVDMFQHPVRSEDRPALIEGTTKASLQARIDNTRAEAAIKDTAEATMNALVTRPAHYTKWAIEPITFTMRNKMEFWRGNIIKYAARAGSKLYDGADAVQSEILDLEKVRRYAEMRINMLKGDSIL